MTDKSAVENIEFQYPMTVHSATSRPQRDWVDAEEAIANARLSAIDKRLAYLDGYKAAIDKAKETFVNIFDKTIGKS